VNVVSDFGVMDIITLGIAVAGLVLGVLNTWQDLSRDRVKIVVRPNRVYPAGPHAQLRRDIKFAIEVVNKSSFPITVSEIGFLFRERKEKLCVIDSLISNGKNSLPVRLEAREAVSFYILGDPSTELGRLSHAYARTACGRLFKGSSNALLKFNAPA
jgi:hypothetical protein